MGGRGVVGLFCLSMNDSIRTGKAKRDEDSEAKGKQLKERKKSP